MSSHEVADDTDARETRAGPTEDESSGSAQRDSGRDKLFGPDAVELTVKVNSVGEVDTATNTFQVDFTIMLDWRDREYLSWAEGEGQGSNKSKSKWTGLEHACFPEVYVENAMEEPVIFGGGDGPTCPRQGDPTEGALKLTRRMRARLGHDFNLRHFPFDYHILTIKFKSRSWTDGQVGKAGTNRKKVGLVHLHPLDRETSLRAHGHCFAADADSMPEWQICLEQPVTSTGVKLGPEKSSVKKRSAAMKVAPKGPGTSPEEQSNLADEKRMNDEFSVGICVVREPWHMLFNAFMFLVLLQLLSFCIYVFDVDELEARFSTVVLLILTDVAFKFAISSSLPRISYLTIWDKYAFGRFAILILQGLGVVLAAALLKGGDGSQRQLDNANLVDRICLATSALLFVTLHVYVVVQFWGARLQLSRTLKKLDSFLTSSRHM